MRILGLDLGTNSIGWAVVDNSQNQIMDTGVRIFPAGIEPDTIGKGDSEKSRNATRREKRQIRRQYFRKRLRKVKLLELLIDQGMCPLTKEDLHKWKNWDRSKKSDGRLFPDPIDFMNWIRLNPYYLREKALNERISLFELGRIFYHFIHRRGFLSSRKSKEDSTIFTKGKPEENILPINETKEKIRNSTLGSYLNSISHKENEPFQLITDDSGRETRIRGRYTIRDMYIAEFERIWAKQSEYHDLNSRMVVSMKTRIFNGAISNCRNQHKIKYLQEKYGKKNLRIEQGDKKRQNKIISISNIPLKQKLGGEIHSTINEGGEIAYEHKSKESILFWQRPLRSQKLLIANCRFENELPVIRNNGDFLKDVSGKVIKRSKKPCPLSHPDFELFRAYQFINNIRYGKNQSLTEIQRIQVLELINNSDSGFEFKKISQSLNLTYEKFNYEDNFKVVGNNTIKKLRGVFSKEIWEDKYEEIWHCFLFFDDDEKLYQKITRDYSYSGDIEKIKKIKLKEGYSNVSLKAIRNILPFLKKGYQYDRAVILGGVKNAFGKRWEYFKESHEIIEREIIKILKENNKEGEAIEKVIIFLSKPSNNYGFTYDDPRFTQLYHHSQDIDKADDLLGEVPKIENLRNPIVQQALNETRRLVNLLIEKYKDEYGSEFYFDRINVEMGRELRNSKTEREDMARRIRENEDKNDEARQRLAEFGLKPSRENIQKYLMYNEIAIRASGPVICPYTGKIINMKNLLGSENAIQIEHIIPYSISLDDSLVNKTLCEAVFNGLKGEKTPYQFYCENPNPDLWGIARFSSLEEGWDAISERAFRILPYPKAKRFTSRKPFERMDFIERQLNDTRYIAKKAKDILSSVCHDVRVMPGQLTAELRHLWGLNNVLQPVKTIEVHEFEISENENLPVYLVADEFGNAVSIKRRQNKRPSTENSEILLSGQVKGQRFESRKFNLNFDAPDIQDGWYWAKIKVSDSLRILPIYTEKPEVDTDHIVFKGYVTKGIFTNDSIGKRKVPLEDGRYWARVAITGMKFEDPVKGKEPAINRNQILLFGNVDNGIFSSYIYKCEANIPDGKYWLILNYNSEEIEFTKAEYPKPETLRNEFAITATIDQDNNLAADIDPGYQKLADRKPGRYYAILTIESEYAEYFPVENKPDPVEKGQELIEGTIWVDTHTGEIKFDPKKNRDDHRHHAVDAITIALTEQGFLQRLSCENANRKNKLRNHPFSTEKFPEPWPGFDKDVRKAVESILVSYKKSNKVLTKNKKGFSVRGQLHKDFIYGKPKLSNEKGIFHIRTKITKLEDHKDLKKVVDTAIKKLIEKHLEINYGIDIHNPLGFLIPKDAFFQNGNWRLFLPNKNGDPVPIKKIRVQETINNAVKLKSSINQWVNPRNNHHVLIYKDVNGYLKADVVTFWTVTERIIQGLNVYKLPDDGNEIVSTIEINDMFLLGLRQEEIISCSNDFSKISNHLFKVQKIAGGENFLEICFRKHVDSRKDSAAKVDYKYIKGFGEGKTGWNSFNPTKVIMDPLGKIISI